MHAAAGEGHGAPGLGGEVRAVGAMLELGAGDGSVEEQVVLEFEVAEDAGGGGGIVV